MSEYLNDPIIAVYLFMGFFAVFYGGCVLAIHFMKWFR